MKKWQKSVVISIASLICIYIALVVARVVMRVEQEPPAKEGKILARVNDQVLTLEEFNQQFEKMKPRQGMGSLRPEMAQEMVEHWIETELLFHEASRRGIDESADLLERLEQVKKSMITQMVLQEEMNKIEVSDEEIEEYFSQNPNRFRIPEMARLKHIQVRTQEEAEKIQDRLNREEEFEKLAGEKSTDVRTKKKGGDLGFMNRSRCRRRFGSSFARIAFSLEKGEISKPVRSSFGYHLIMLEEKREPSQQMSEQIRERAKIGALRLKKRKRSQEFIESLRNKAQIEKHLELLPSSERPPAIEEPPLGLPPLPEPGAR